MNSLFQSNAFCTEKEIGIGLERYLGKKVDVIKELPNEPFYDWIKETSYSFEELTELTKLSKGLQSIFFVTR